MEEFSAASSNRDYVDLVLVQQARRGEGRTGGGRRLLSRVQRVTPKPCVVTERPVSAYRSKSLVAPDTGGFLRTLET